MRHHPSWPTFVAAQGAFYIEINKRKPVLGLTSTLRYAHPCDFLALHHPERIMIQQNKKKNIVQVTIMKSQRDRN